MRWHADFIHRRLHCGPSRLSLHCGMGRFAATVGHRYLVFPPMRAIASLLSGLLLLAALPACAAPLILAEPPGALANAVHDVVLVPFLDQTGIPLASHPWDGEAATLPGLFTGERPADLLLLRGDMLLRACHDGNLAKIDWDALGGKQRFLPQAVQDCGMGVTVVTTVLAWDRDKYQGTPNWADFWDIAKIPGKRGLHRGPRTTLEIALLADGVAAADIYKTLRTPEGVDRAFRKLDQLRPYIVWWKSGAEAVRILAAGDVLLTSAPNGDAALAARAQKRNLGLQWANSLASVMSWAERSGSTEQDQALKFLKFAADPAVQARLEARIPYGGLSRGANDHLPPERADDHLPPELAELSSGAHLAASIPIDETFWRDNAGPLTQRFEAWMGK